MKEFLTSFLSSTMFSIVRGKSVKQLPLKPNRYFIPNIFLVIALLFIFSPTSFAQSNATSPTSEIPVAKDYAGTKWKTTPELINTFTIEHNQNLQVLSSPGLQPTDIAIYTGYDHLLSFIQADLPSGNPLADIAVADFQKVVDEAQTNPTLKYLHVGALRNLFNQLIEKMALPNVPIPINH